MRRTIITCHYCGKKYKYNKCYNKHQRRKHRKEIEETENSPFCILQAINNKEIMESLNKEAEMLIIDANKSKNLLYDIRRNLMIFGNAIVRVK